MSLNQANQGPEKAESGLQRASHGRHRASSGWTEKVRPPKFHKMNIF